MTEIEHLLRNHRSIRSFKDEPIDHAILPEILETATHSATSRNLQPYCVVVTRDAERRRRLWDLHSEQGMILEAPRGRGWGSATWGPRSVAATGWSS